MLSFFLEFNLNSFGVNSKAKLQTNLILLNNKIYNLLDVFFHSYF